MAAISAILNIYLKSVFIFFILNGVATACCMRRIAENGWFEIDALREGLTIFEILAVSVIPIIRIFFFIGIIVMSNLDAEEYYRSKYGDNEDNSINQMIEDDESEEDNNES